MRAHGGKTDEPRLRGADDGVCATLALILALPLVLLLLTWGVSAGVLVPPDDA
jgi:hypothetical protein